MDIRNTLDNAMKARSRAGIGSTKRHDEVICVDEESLL